MANRNVGSKFIRGVVRSRRESVWIPIGTFEATLSGAPSAALGLSLNAAALALRPFTIVRSRGIFQARSDQLAADEIYGADLGMAVVTFQASTVGVTVVPTPVTDKGSDQFFVYEQLFGRIQIGSGAGTGPPTDLSQVVHFDSKAMRKVGEDDDVICAVENEINGVIVVVSGRMLLKLH